MGYTVGWEDIEEGIDTGLTANAKIRDAFINTQTNFNSVDDRLNGLETFENEFMSTVLSGNSVAVNQLPVAVDTALQLEFGPAQNDVNDDAMLSVDGKLVFNRAGTYVVKFNAHYGRDGVALTSLLAFRWLKNAVMHGTPLVTKIDDDTTLHPWESELVVTVDIGDEFTAEIMRDSNGHNSGGLYKTTLVSAGWGDAPSASISVKKLL